MKFIPVLIILIVIISGCTTTSTVNQTQNVTTVPTTVEETHTPSVPIVAATPTKPVVTPEWPPLITPKIVSPDSEEENYEDEEYYEEEETFEVPPTESNVSAILFTTYSDGDGDFTVDYPAGWTSSSKTIRNVDNRRYTMDKFKPDMRVVTITSEDNNVTFTAYTSDFIAPGKTVITPTMDWCRDNVHSAFPDVGGSSAIINYAQKPNENGNSIVTFDVIIPESSQWYPYAYYGMVTSSYGHFYQFTLGLENGEIDKYRDLRNKMFSSIKVEGMSPPVRY